MITRIGRRLYRARRMISRAEWLARLLGLPFVNRPTSPALVIIQIDGLARGQFERAISDGRMPFVKRLLDDEHYRLHDVFSGLPSATASFQGELFYGVRQSVPGFGFLDRETNDLVRMIEPGPVEKIEKRLEAESTSPLLKGGAALSVNFTGGADNSHFCPTARGFGASVATVKPLYLPLLLIAHLYSFVRVGVLILLEIALAVVDFVRGIAHGHSFIEELKFVPSRVIITILLRELVTIAAKVHIARGAPIVHLNLLGYDEQAHRRGPSSAFAHWTLKGIDDAIARIWRAAHRSTRRHYDVWIHSDHGQAHMRSYRSVAGRPVSEAIAEAFAEHFGHPVDYRDSGAFGEQIHRRGLLGSRLSVFEDVADDSPPLAVSAQGPLAMVYWHHPLDAGSRRQLARALREKTGVPLVLSRGDDGEVMAWTPDAELTLPRDAAIILGEDHPYREATSEDLVALCHHPNAGDFILSGWMAGHEAVTFPRENGSHGGGSPDEVSAFALLPPDIRFAPSQSSVARASDLRRAARAFLSAKSGLRHPSARGKLTFRLVTYNVHGCVGMDGQLSPSRIARVIAGCRPDIVALQELDVGRERSGGIDQAHRIAAHLGMAYHFHPAIHVEEERYGDAILTPLPMRLVRGELLPRSKFWKPEPRGALWVEIDIDGIGLNVINTHFGLSAWERAAQAEALLGIRWLGHPDCQAPRILCGDFNSLPGGVVYRRLTAAMNDAQKSVPEGKPQATFASNLPRARIDHVFTDAGIVVRGAEVPASTLARMASDHLPLVVEFEIDPDVLNGA